MADDYTFGDVVRLIDALAESTQASFTRVEGRLDRIETRLDALTTEVRTGFERVERRLDRHETRIEALETQP